MDIAALVAEARRFGERVKTAKAALGDPGFEWYPHETLSAFANLEKTLTGASRGIFAGSGRVLDLGAQDGELAFFLESLGYQVAAADHPAYNHNGMRGIHALKGALGSAVEIHEIDVDRPFMLPHDSYGLVVMLGVLYHLRNPFYVLEELARRTSHCLLSTRIARCYPDGTPMPAGVSLAYLLAENELNDDNSNYFIFNEAGLRVMLERAHWEIVDYASLGETHLSDPVRLDRDERAFCLLRSRYNRLANLELLEGWHESEETGWRWTARQFAVKVHSDAAPRTLTMKLWVAEESIRRFGRLRLEASVNGHELEAAVLENPGLATFTRRLETSTRGVLDICFCLDSALPPDATDSRERGVVVAELTVE
jgi:tRNA (mo5U34)-methyltransferase